MGDETGRQEFEAARMHPWSWDSTSDTTTWAPGVAELFGVSLDDFDGTLNGFLALVHADDRAAAAATIERAFSSGSVEFELQHRVLLRAGKVRWIQGRGEVVRDESGVPCAIRGVVWDITAQKENELREARMRRLLAVVAAINRESARGDSRGLLAAACRIAVEEGGFRFAWIGQRDASGRVVPLASAGHEDGFLMLDDVRAIGKSPIEGPTMKAIRERRPSVCSDIANDPAYVTWRDAALARGFRASAAFPFERDGVAVGALNVYADQPGIFQEEEVQLLWRLAADIGNALERLELRASMEQNERLLALGRLARGVAHEINNPLSYVVLSVDELERSLRLNGQSPDAQLAAVARARDGAERIRRIVRDLIAFGRGEEEESGPVDLGVMLSSAINLTESLIKPRARLQTDFRATRPASGNAHRLGQVAVNLLVNAADAIADGTPDRHEIHVVTKDDGEHVSFSIRDTGEGMDRETMARAFDPFFTTKPVGEGTGLGLSIAHGIVTKMGGSIDVTSEPGLGATFTVRLPACAPDAAPKIESAPTVTSAHRRRQILVIDDEEQIRVVLVRALADDDVTVAKGAFEAAAICRERDFDCILCDVTMPAGDGVDFLEAVRAQGRGAEARVVFMSGGAYSRRSEELLQHASNPHLDKPFRIADALAAVDRVTRPAAH
jgi:PAS domain S-box-containing protein